MKVTIIRYDETKEATFGKMFIDNYSDKSPFAFTLEPPALINLPQISCIPQGIYTCKRHSGLKYGCVWEVCDVPGRNEILIHNGNLPEHTEGCILIGSNRGLVNNQKGIINSKETLKDFMTWTMYETELSLVVELALPTSTSVRS